MTRKSKEAVKKWASSRMEEEGGAWWIDSFIDSKLQHKMRKLAKRYMFDDALSRSIRKAHAKRSKKRGRDLTGNDSSEMEEDKELPREETSSSSLKRSKRTSKKRNVWTVLETAVLCKGVLKFGGGKWAQIKEASALKRRTGGQCKDKMRVIAKNNPGDLGWMELAKRWLSENECDHCDDVLWEK